MRIIEICQCVHMSLFFSAHSLFIVLSLSLSQHETISRMHALTLSNLGDKNDKFQLADTKKPITKQRRQLSFSQHHTISKKKYFNPSEGGRTALHCVFR
jgi:hypothetical protein